MVGVGNESELPFVFAILEIGRQVTPDRMIPNERRIECELDTVRVAGCRVLPPQVCNPEPRPTERPIVILFLAVDPKAEPDAQHRSRNPFVEKRVERRRRPYGILQIVPAMRREKRLVAVFLVEERMKFVEVFSVLLLRRALDKSARAHVNGALVETEVEHLQPAVRNECGLVAPIRNRPQDRFRVLHWLPL